MESIFVYRGRKKGKTRCWTCPDRLYILNQNHKLDLKHVLALPLDLTHPSQGEQLFLIDGSGFIFRAFHALPPMTSPDGVPVNAVFGFANMLHKLLQAHEFAKIAVIFDAARANYRNEIYPQYKANRAETPPELIPQFSLIREVTRAFGLKAIELEGYEADDLIATYADQALEAGYLVTIVSSDKDLMQLIRPGIRLFDPMKSKNIGEPEVIEKFGVLPHKVIDIQALAGDTSDNIPGVPGIGVKTAAELINTYGDLETLLARAGEIKQPKRRQSLIDFADLARISKQLVSLHHEVPVPMMLEELVLTPYDRDVLRAFLTRMGFRSLLARVEKETDGQSTESVEKAYSLVQTTQGLHEWIERIKKAGFVVIDTETNSLSAHSAMLVGISLSIKPGEGAYIPLSHAQALGQLPMDVVIGALKPVLEDASIMKIGHNLKFDLQVLAQHGIAMNPIDDTMVMSAVLETGIHGHGMDELAKLYFDHDTIKYKDVVGTGKSQVTFDHVSLDKACDYAAEDADITCRLYHLLKPRILRERRTELYETIERPLIPVVARMEQIGVLVDRNRLMNLSDEFAAQIAKDEAEIFALAGQEFNVGSPKQLGDVLFEVLGLPGGKKSKLGAYGTSSEVLEPLALEHPVVQKVLDWRRLSKLKSTYADALVSQISPKTGRLHTSYNLVGTNTGRLSSSDPNLQNIPVRSVEGKQIREAFVAADGYVLMSVDYSQIELRLMAEIAGVHALRDAFAAGLDIHTATAAKVFGVALDQVTPDYRRQAKAINFGIIYGMSGFGLAQHLGCSTAEATAFIEQYFKTYPEILTYMDGVKAFCREKGYVTTIFGRYCYVPTILDKNPAIRNFAERQAINAPMQGATADLIKLAMIKLDHSLKGARMLLQVHDELVFEVPEDQVDQTKAFVQDVMENIAHLSVPLKTEAKVGRNWGFSEVQDVRRLLI